MSKNKKILVTEPSLPDLDEFVEALKVIWNEKWLTNGGPFHEKFEKEIAKYLDVKHISLFNNGTIALLTAIQALKISGEVITTPYSFVATSHALNWNNITPVFCDVDPIYGNLDVNKIEQLITPKTTAILPVHVYGNPVNVNEIQKIADTYGIKIIYDAAHAFGVKIDKQSILNFGDLSILSFHATKKFNTIEGGAIISHDAITKKRIDYLKNFGIANETTVVGPGINGKMNELQSAYGLLQLKSISSEINKCKVITEYYRKLLRNLKGIRFHENISNVKHNYSYFPIFIKDDEFGMSRDDLFFKLREHNIYARRYFYPLITDFPTYKHLRSSNPKHLPNANKISSEVICLPLYPNLTKKEVDFIIDVIKS